MRNRIFKLFPFYKPRHKALTGPKLTKSNSQILRRASDGYRLEPMPPYPAVASPDGAAEASPGRAVMASPSVGGESLQRHPERLAWADLHEITRGGSFKIIECLKQAGEGARKVF